MRSIQNRLTLGIGAVGTNQVNNLNSSVVFDQLCRASKHDPRTLKSPGPSQPGEAHQIFDFNRTKSATFRLLLNFTTQIVELFGF
jgi:hypothetical protein